MRGVRPGRLKAGEVACPPSPSSRKKRGHAVQIEYEYEYVYVFHNAMDPLDRASTSIPLNIAEGNGKRSRKDRCRFLDISRASALESASSLDVMVARRVCLPDQASNGKELLVRIVGMLTKLIERLAE
jgi:four helix bundle protein